VFVLSNLPSWVSVKMPNNESLVFNLTFCQNDLSCGTQKGAARLTNNTNNECIIMGSWPDNPVVNRTANGASLPIATSEATCNGASFYTVLNFLCAASDVIQPDSLEAVKLDDCGYSIDIPTKDIPWCSVSDCPGAGNADNQLVASIQAANFDCFNDSLAQGANPNMTVPGTEANMTAIGLVFNTTALNSTERYPYFQALLEAGADPNVYDSNPVTPILHLILEKKTQQAGTCVEQIDLFLNHGANPNADAISMPYSLMYCPLVTQSLLEHGGSPNGVMMGYDKPAGDTMLAYVCSKAHKSSTLPRSAYYIDLAGTFIEKGANVTASNDKTGETALMAAAEVSPLSIVTSLLDHGAMINRGDAAGKTALMFATQGANEEVIQELIKQGAETEKFTSDGMNALYYAITGADPAQALATLLNSTMPANSSLMMAAVETGNLQAVLVLRNSEELFDELNADILKTNEHGRTAIGEASYQCMLDIRTYLTEKYTYLCKHDSPIVMDACYALPPYDTGKPPVFPECPTTVPTTSPTAEPAAKASHGGMVVVALLMVLFAAMSLVLFYKLWRTRKDAENTRAAHAAGYQGMDDSEQPTSAQ